MQEPGKTEELTEGLKRYVNTNLKLIKLEVAERSSVIGSGLASKLLVGLAGILFIFFISLWAGFYISVELNDSYSGFIIVAGFYFLLTIILLIGRKKILEEPMRDKIIRKLFSKN